jgi:hypothetical protein
MGSFPSSFYITIKIGFSLFLLPSSKKCRRTKNGKRHWEEKRKKTSAENSENLSQYSGKRGETG